MIKLLAVMSLASGGLRSNQKSNGMSMMAVEFGALCEAAGVMGLKIRADGEVCGIWGSK